VKQEAAVAYLKVLTQHLLETEENWENSQSE